MQPRNASIFLVLSLLLALGAAILFLFFDTAIELPQPNSSAEQYLRKEESSAEAFPAHLVALFLLIFVAQLLPLLIASRRSERGAVSLADLREISFLCEVPMYLGLLGSLLGVCLTQFLTGSLAAPLAYLTTISGILLFLFARLAIWFPLSRRQSEIARSQVNP